MPIQYSLQPNKTKGAQPGEYRAVVRHIDTLDFEDLLDHFTQRNHAIHRSTALMVMHAFFEMVEDLASEGYAITTPIFNVKLGVKGKFTGSDDQFYANRHQVTINCSSNKKLKKTASRLRAYKTEAHEHRPYISSVYDYHTETTNSTITPGNILRLRGQYIKMNPEHTDERIIFRNANNEEFAPKSVFKNSDRETMLQVSDDLPAGEYRIAIYTRPSGSNVLRSFISNHPLVCNVL